MKLQELEVNINGLPNPLNVDLEVPIQVSWRATSYWKNYKLDVMDEENNIVYSYGEEDYQQPAHYFNLDKSIQRTKYNYELILSNDITSARHEGFFYSESSAFQEANWITRLDDPHEKERMYFREKNNIIFNKTIEINEPVDYSIIDISGLGYYVLYVNDIRVGDSYLITDVTNYGKTIFYDSFNLEEYLIEGKNKLEIHLGNGWYNPAPLGILGKYNVRKELTVGRQTLKAVIETKTASGDIIEISSDESWETSAGNLLYNDVYVGEIYDDNKVENVVDKTVIVRGPQGQIRPSFIPKIKRQELITPDKIYEHNEMDVYDLGRVITGQIAIEIPEEYIGTIQLYYAEDLSEDGELDFSSTISGLYSLTDKVAGVDRDDPIIQKDVIRKSKYDHLKYENEFTYHSFRYVGVEFLDSKTDIKISAFPTHTNVKPISTFESSSNELNDIWQSGINTRLNNIHSYFEDCSREKFGYGGDIVALLESHLVTSDIGTLLKKVLNDFSDDQQKDGGITQTAPYIGIMTNGPSNGSGSLGWQLVFPTIANTIAHHYGDDQFVKKYQSKFEEHIQYLLGFSYDFIRLCCLGDWGSVNESAREQSFLTSPDQEFCASNLYLLNLIEYSKLTQYLSLETTLVKKIEDKIMKVKELLIREYYNEDGSFANKSQSSYIFALKTNLYEEKNELLVKNLVNKIKEENHTFTFGIFGMSWAYQILPEYGYNDIIFEWLLKAEKPSYISMLSNGNHSLKEHFPTEKGRKVTSSNHAMFSSYSYWFVKELLGIKEANNKGSAKLTINPNFQSKLDYINGNYLSRYGIVNIKWEKLNNSINLEIVTPVTLEVEITLDDMNVKNEEKFEDLENQKVKYIYLIEE